MLANAVASLFVNDQTSAPTRNSFKRVYNESVLRVYNESVLRVYNDYVEGLLRTPSFDTVPEWMQAGDNDDDGNGANATSA